MAQSPNTSGAPDLQKMLKEAQEKAFSPKAPEVFTKKNTLEAALESSKTPTPEEKPKFSQSENAKYGKMYGEAQRLKNEGNVGAYEAIMKNLEAANFLSRNEKVPEGKEEQAKVLAAQAEAFKKASQNNVLDSNTREKMLKESIARESELNDLYRPTAQKIEPVAKQVEQKPTETAAVKQTEKSPSTTEKVAEKKSEPESKAEQSQKVAQADKTAKTPSADKEKNSEAYSPGIKNPTKQAPAAFAVSNAAAAELGEGEIARAVPIENQSVKAVDLSKEETAPSKLNPENIQVVTIDQERVAEVEKSIQNSPAVREFNAQFDNSEIGSAEYKKQFAEFANQPDTVSFEGRMYSVADAASLPLNEKLAQALDKLPADQTEAPKVLTIEGTNGQSFVIATAAEYEKAKAGLDSAGISVYDENIKVSLKNEAGASKEIEMTGKELITYNLMAASEGKLIEVTPAEFDPLNKKIEIAVADSLTTKPSELATAETPKEKSAEVLKKEEFSNALEAARKEEGTKEYTSYDGIKYDAGIVKLVQDTVNKSLAENGSQTGLTWREAMVATEAALRGNEPRVEGNTSRDWSGEVIQVESQRIKELFEQIRENRQEMLAQQKEFQTQIQAMNTKDRELDNGREFSFDRAKG